MESLVLRDAPVVLTSDLHNLGAGEAFLTDAVSVKDVSNLGVPGVRVFYKITMGSSSPGPGASLAFYTLFSDGDTLMDAGVPETNDILDGASTPTLAEVLTTLPAPAHTVSLVNAVDLVYQGSFFVPLDSVASFSLIVLNNSLSDLSTTFGDHKLTYVASRFSSS